MPRRERAAMINSLSGFKSACLLGTRAANGLENLAIVSSCFHIGADPALMGLLMRPHSVPRHSLENIIETGCFTLSHVNRDMYRAAHHTSARFEREQSEFQGCGLTAEYWSDFAAPFVKEARIRLGLALVETHTLQVNETVLVIGALTHVQVPDDCLGDDGYVDIERAQTVAISGMDGYHATQRLARLSYAKPDQEPDALPVDQ